MTRRFISLAAAVALTLGVGVTAASSAGAAKAPPVNASGSLHCSVAGKVKFSTPLLFSVNSGPSTFTAKFKTQSPCTGTSGVTSFGGTFSATLPSSDCLALALTDLPAASISAIKLKGSQKYNVPTINYTAGGTFTPDTPITMDEPGNGTSSVTGSFAGQEPNLHLVFDQGTEALATNCTAKTKGLKGSGGLKKMSFNAASYIDIAP